MSQTVITKAFAEWKAQQAVDNKPVVLDEFVFAFIPGQDANKPIPNTEGMPAADKIVYRQAVSKSGVVNANAVVYSVVMGTEVGDFDFNWIGLINKATGIIGAITHAPTQRKVKNASGQQGNTLTRSIMMEYAGAQAETQITVPAATWQIDFTARMAGMDEALRLANFDIYGAGAFFDTGFLVSKNGTQFFVTKGLGYVGGLRASLAANQNITVTTKPTKVWIDVCYTGTVTSAFQTAIKFTVAPTLSNYATNGVAHYVFALASIDAAGNVTDLRPKGSLSDQQGSKDFLRKDQALAELKILGAAAMLNARDNIGAMSNQVLPVNSTITRLDDPVVINKTNPVSLSGKFEDFPLGPDVVAAAQLLTLRRAWDAGAGAYQQLINGNGQIFWRIGTYIAAQGWKWQLDNSTYPFGWRRVFDTGNPPTPAEVGALAAKDTAVAATKLATARKIAGVNFDGTQDISLKPADVGALPVDATAKAASKLETARKIAGVNFDGTQDISITAANVGALPTTGGNVEYVTGARYFATKSGLWEGAGAFAAQLENGSAPFMVPNGFMAPKNVSQYQPIVKGIIKTKDYNYAASVSFGGVTSGNAQFPMAVISITTDAGAVSAWTFNPVDNSFYSPGDINTGKNISAAGNVSVGGSFRAEAGITSPNDIYTDRNIYNKGIIQAGSGVYDTPGVRVYSPNYRPQPSDVNAIARDTCSYAGFSGGNPQSPYMRNSNNDEVVALARTDWVNSRVEDVLRWAQASFVSSITRGAQASMVMDGWLVEAPAGCVLTGGNGNEGSQIGYALYRPLQMFRNGGWVTIDG
ncbi:MAG: phage tail-collar fiber domain-containing protein [Ewingella sp.]|uniref:phage tail-collar fiber domain-containing protein n=1 Tax=Ewingella TaxID=41201 RepID=UPI0033654F0F